MKWIQIKNLKHLRMMEPLAINFCKKNKINYIMLDSLLSDENKTKVKSLTDSILFPLKFYLIILTLIHIAILFYVYKLYNLKLI